MTRRLLDRVEDLATERYGVGTSLSADQEHGEWRIRVWNVAGYAVLVTNGETKAEALGAMRRKLAKPSDRTGNAP